MHFREYLFLVSLNLIDSGKNIFCFHDFFSIKAKYFINLYIKFTTSKKSAIIQDFLNLNHQL